MNDEFMASVQKVVANAIAKQADKEIEKQKEAFAKEMEKYKGEVVGRIVNGLRVVREMDPTGKALTIQIVLKGE